MLHSRLLKEVWSSAPLYSRFSRSWACGNGCKRKVCQRYTRYCTANVPGFRYRCWCFLHFAVTPIQYLHYRDCRSDEHFGSFNLEETCDDLLFKGAEIFSSRRKELREMMRKGFWALDMRDLQEVCAFFSYMAVWPDFPFWFVRAKASMRSFLLVVYDPHFSSQTKRCDHEMDMQYPLAQFHACHVAFGIVSR